MQVSSFVILFRLFSSVLFNFSHTLPHFSLYLPNPWPIVLPFCSRTPVSSALFAATRATRTLSSAPLLPLLVLVFLLFSSSSCAFFLILIFFCRSVIRKSRNVCVCGSFQCSGVCKQARGKAVLWQPTERIAGSLEGAVIVSETLCSSHGPSECSCSSSSSSSSLVQSLSFLLFFLLFITD